ncbi:Hypothetical protein PHPALM_13172 [Phytophthora palmivora]|uniref:Uncharacterized protein n=1 Tax=Phytophthora palmivora TaxID=4796 RepID=A0A2P4XXX1_9STRA|nr:Hypothetical protein PHPALM_13172 [Phytophthora palmivora]
MDCSSNEGSEQCDQCFVLVVVGMGKATEVVAPVAPVMVEEQPSPVEDPLGLKTLVSLEQLEQLKAAESSAERVDRLQCALGVQHYPVNPRTNVWVDFCFGVLNFAQDEACLPPEKTLTLLTLAHEVYVFATQPTSDSPANTLSEPMPPSSPDLPEDASITKGTIPARAHHTSLGAYPSVEAVYDQFREKIRQASGMVTNNDSAEDANTLSTLASTPFLPMEVAQIVAFFTSTFFRHLRAYQYLSRVPRPSFARELPMATETPLHPGTLADATLQAE